MIRRITLILLLSCFAPLQLLGQDSLNFANQLSDAFENVATKISPSLVNIQAIAKPKPVPRSYKRQDRRRGPQGIPDPFQDFLDQFGIPHGNSPGNGRPRQGLGSGVIVDAKGHILTNNHVVAGSTEIIVRMNDKKEYEASIIGTDPKTDLAVIKIDAKAITAADLGDSDSLKIGEWVLAAGAPFGLDNSITAGIVSAKGRNSIISDRDSYEDFIQTDAAINPGNSGGPLLNLSGQVIGINTAIFSRSGGYQGIGFAIPINMAKSVMQSLIDTGKVARGYIGVGIQNLSPELAKSFGYDSTNGALVGHITVDSPGDKAGLQQGDIITELNGKTIENINKLRNTVAATKPGTKVSLKIFRDKRYQTLSIKLGELDQQGPKEATKLFSHEAENPKLDLGMELETLDKELAERFRLKINAGVLVKNVLPGSVAEQAGLTPGDVITKAGDKSISTIEDFVNYVTEERLEEGIRLIVFTQTMQRFVFLQNDSQ